MSLSLDTSSIIANTNVWLTALLPIFGLVIGLTLAMGILNMLVKKFKSIGG